MIIMRSALSSLALALSLSSAAAAPLEVVATFSILSDMVSEVGGERVKVTTLVGPNGDAHVYEPTPADAKVLATADLVVMNGLGFEAFIERLTEAAGYKGPLVVATAKIVPLESGQAHTEADHAGKAADDGHAHHHDAQDEGHSDHDHGATDPHAWQNLANGMFYVTAIAEGLCNVDAEGCPLFQKNAEAYRSEMAALDKEIRSQIDAVPEARRKAITSHDAFGYFAKAYDVTFLAPQGVSTDSEASASDVANLIRQIKANQVKTVFVENIADPRLIQQIAAETGASVGTELYSDALSTADGPAPTYLDMMRHNAKALIAAMTQGL